MCEEDVDFYIKLRTLNSKINILNYINQEIYQNNV